jgi:anaerobic magnesium-protoporphyrin IX monomethyl ester cyclase
MRVLFIYPNLNAQIGFSYGLAYISGALRAHGIETSLLNVNEQVGYPLDLDRIRADVRRINPHVIGFSVLTNQYKYAVEIARDLKRHINTPIVFGGIHPTMDPEGTLAEECVDCICIGEGEEAFLEFLGKGSPRGVRNMGYRENGRVVLEPLRPYVDVRKLPFKDYLLFDFQQMIDAKDGWVGIQASRGCPFRCTYCLNHKIIDLYKRHGHLPREYLRRHSVEEMVLEIEYLLSHYERIKMFIFDDDIFTFDKEWLKVFSRRYKEVTDIPFVCNAHARIFDSETAQYLKDGGCRIVKFGLESGSDRIRRKVLQRFMSNRHIEQAFDAADRAGFHTSAFVMVGLPEEKKEDIMETVKLLAKIKPGRFRWSLFFPFIGTRAYDIAKASGTIDFEKMESLDNFTDETCMLLGPEEDLLIDKLKTFFCLFVNGYADIDGEHLYGDLLREVEEADRTAWRMNKASFAERLSLLDREAAERGKLHYTVKYNRFMGVRSDWQDDSLSS